jgi:glycosyltransferase involved in cell wall biosynthesis
MAVACAQSRELPATTRSTACGTLLPSTQDLNVIVILYPQFHAIGGIARYLDAYLSNLPAHAPEVVLVTGDEVPNPPQYKGVTLVHLPLHRTRWGLAWWSWQARRYVEALNRLRPISALNLHIPPLIPGMFLGSGIPIVLTAHTTYLGMSGRFDGNRHFESPWSALSLWFKMRMEQRLFARADTVITLTEQGRDELARYGRMLRVAIVPNGVDLAEFQPQAGVVQDIDVIFSGRIERRKGSRPMVDVCRLLVAAHPGIRIAIVGYGDDEAHVWRSLSHLGENVLLTGKVSFGEMVALYRRSKVYVSTSYYEGLPGTCLEAMAIGLPAVVWDQPFYKGLVMQGATGWVVPTNDLNAMTERVGGLLQDKALRASTSPGARGRGVACRAAVPLAA